LFLLKSLQEVSAAVQDNRIKTFFTCMVADFVFQKDTWIFTVPCLVKPMFSNNFNAGGTVLLYPQIDFQDSLANIETLT